MIVEKYQAYFAEPKHFDSLRSNRANCSELGTCYRKRVWRARGKKGQPRSGKSVEKMDRGTMIHERLEKIAWRMGVLRWSEVTLADGELSGHFDMIWDVGGKNVLVDIKTKHHWVFKNAKAPDMSEKMQVCAYKKLVEETTNRHIDEIYILYVDADTSNGYEMKEFPVVYDHAMVSRINNDIAKFANYMDAGGDPPVGPEQDWECKKDKAGNPYCEYHSICYGGE